jgi:hypothetical protein
MSIYYSQNIYSLFNNIISNNNKNIIVSGDHNISISNKYYLFFINNDDIYNDIFNFLTDNLVNDEITNKFNNKLEIAFDNEQILQINLINYNIKTLNDTLHNLFQIINESDAELIVYFDIKYIIDFILNSNIETHIFDFIIHKLNNKADKLYIYENNNIKFNLKNSLFIKQIFTVKKNYSISSSNNNFIFVYKLNNNNIKYWNIYNNNTDNIDESDIINSDDSDNIDLHSNIKIIYINNQQFLLTKINISDLIHHNLFTNHNELIIHPIDKINIFI